MNVYEKTCNNSHIRSVINIKEMKDEIRKVKERSDTKETDHFSLTHMIRTKDVSLPER